MSMPYQQAESEALLLIVRVELSEAERARLHTLIAKDFDWDYFYLLALRHSLVPLVYQQLKSSIKDQVPAEVLQRFRKDFQENAARNLVLTDELISIIKSFAQDGIESIAFKGPALAVAAYDDLSLRRFIDLDLIARRADMPRAIEILQQHGYTAAKALNDEQLALLLRTQHNLQFTRDRFIVELHWRVASELFASSVTAEELWQHLETIEINGTSVKTLSTEDLLFALCVHGSRHLWQRLAWICDIDRIIRTRRYIDWQMLMARAQKANAQRMFLLGVALSHQLLGTELPGAVCEAISRDDRIARLVEEIAPRLFDGPEQRAFSFSQVFRFNFLIRSDWRSRMRYSRFLLAPTDSDLEMLRLSKPLHFLYYLLRPFRLLQSASSRDSDSPRAAGAQN